MGIAMLHPTYHGNPDADCSPGCEPIPEPLAGRLMRHGLVCEPMPVQSPHRGSNPLLPGGSGRGLGGRFVVGAGVGEPSQCQGAALFNQGSDLFNHGIAGKTLPGAGLELARRGWQ